MFRNRRLLSRRKALRLLSGGAAGIGTNLRAELARPFDGDCVSAPQRLENLQDGLTTATNIVALIRSRKMSAMEVLESYIKRIEAANPKLNAFVFLDLESARKVAGSIDEKISRGEDPGSLAGVPFGVKDLDDCAGMPTTQGSLIYKGGPPAASDSPHVARVRRAGAVIIGKTATPEFGWLSITASKALGVTRNPWNPSFSPGGSSGGTAAAISAGMVPLATGSDIGGSIRSPAAFTGLVGLKPSYGRIGLIAPEDRNVKGCLSLTVRDTARFLDVVAGPTPLDRTSLPPANAHYEQLIELLDVEGLRAIWSPDLGFIPTEQECIDVARRTAEVLVREAKLTWVDHRFTLPGPSKTTVPWYAAQLRGELELDGIWPGKADQLTAEVRSDLSSAGSFASIDLARVERARRELEVKTAELFQKADVLFMPVTTVVSLPAEGPVPATIAGRDATRTGAEAHLKLANLTWLPAISVPAGLSSSGLPIGLQIVCARWREDIALRLARILELVQPWPLLAPAYRQR